MSSPNTTLRIVDRPSPYPTEWTVEELEPLSTLFHLYKMFPLATQLSAPFAPPIIWEAFKEYVRQPVSPEELIVARLPPFEWPTLCATAFEVGLFRLAIATDKEMMRTPPPCPSFSANEEARRRREYQKFMEPDAHEIDDITQSWNIVE